MTAGFYKKEKDRLLFAPNAVHFPDGTSILVAEKDSLTEPVNGWEYFSSEDAAYAAAGLTKPEPLAKLDRRAQRQEQRAIAPDDRRAQRQEQRAQREAERLQRLEQTNPKLAEKVRARSEQRATRLASRPPLKK